MPAFAFQGGEEAHIRVGLFSNDDPGRTRTCNQTIKSRLLCQLSYEANAGYNYNPGEVKFKLRCKGMGQRWTGWLGLAIVGVLVGVVWARPATATLSSDAQLAARFAPLVYGHYGEVYWPMAIEPAVALAHLYYGPPLPLTNPTPEELAQLPYNTPDSYLDFPCRERPFFDHILCTRRMMAAFYQSLSQSPEWAPLVYTRVYRDDPDHIVVQYWFFYYFNPGHDIDIIAVNQHQGDWENMQVVLDANEQPLYVVMAQHGEGTRRLWEYVDREGDRPKVYVAKGTHASYFTPYPYRLFGNEEIGINDKPGRQALFDPAHHTLAELSGAEPWLAFTGSWGKVHLEWIPWNDGPSGPAQKDIWQEPLAWGLTWDELAEHNINKYRCSTTYPGEVDVYHLPTGRHTGRLPDGTVEEQLLTSEYIDNPLAAQRTILLHWPEAPAWDNYSCEISAEAAGVLTVTLNLPDAAGHTVTQATFANLTWTPAMRGWITHQAQLALDANGDGQVDATLAPTTLSTRPLDLTAPATVTDLTARLDAGGRVELTWTAVGDDGQTGTALAYDVRYASEPLTEANWGRATLIVGPGRPQPAGELERWLASLPAGRHCLALQVVDEALQESPLSNSACITIAP